MKMDMVRAGEIVREAEARLRTQCDEYHGHTFERGCHAAEDPRDVALAYLWHRHQEMRSLVGRFLGDLWEERLRKFLR